MSRLGGQWPSRISRLIGVLKIMATLSPMLVTVKVRELLGGITIRGEVAAYIGSVDLGLPSLGAVC